MSSTPYTSAAPLGPVIPFPRARARSGPSADAIRGFELAAGAFERMMDFCAVVAAIWLAYWIHATWRGPVETQYSKNAVLAFAAGFAVVMVLLLEKHGDYRRCLSLLAVRETERLLRVTMAGVSLALPMLLVATGTVPRTMFGLAAVIVPLILALEKWQMQKAIRMMRRHASFTRKAVILGTGTLGRRIFSALVCSPKVGIDPVAFAEAGAAIEEPEIYESSYQRNRKARVLPGPVTPRLLRRLNAQMLILAEPELDPEETAAIRSEAEAAGISTYVIPEPFLDEAAAVAYIELDGVMLAHKAPTNKREFYEAGKRALDVGLSALSLAVLSPLLAAAALAVKLTTPGPVIFRQQRVGRNGIRFEMYKFRTMYTDSARYAYSPTRGKDPRITPVGRWLRHTCIDELPQLLNVLRGEMSLVGPRPEMPFIVEQYEAIHLKRLAVKPGITGLWQLSADRSSPIHENITYDPYYAKNRNLVMDIAILLHTVVFAFRGV